MKSSKFGFAMIVAIWLGASGLLISCTSSGPTLVSKSQPSKIESPEDCTNVYVAGEFHNPLPSEPRKGKTPSTGKLSKVEIAECPNNLANIP